MFTRRRCIIQQKSGGSGVVHYVNASRTINTSINIKYIESFGISNEHVTQSAEKTMMSSFDMNSIEEWHVAPEPPTPGKLTVEQFINNTLDMNSDEEW